MVITPGVARAQSPGRIEIAGGVRWFASESLGAEPSEQLKNGGTTRTVFSSDTQLGPSLGFDGRIGMRIAPRVQLEGAFVFNPTEATTEVSGDVEGAADVTASTSLTEYLGEAGLRLDLRAPRRGQTTAMLLAGGGYVRQVSRGNTLIETGRSFYVGAGLDMPWRDTRSGTTTGLRLEVRAVGVQGGIAPDDDVRIRPALSASLYFRF
jgi:hypothetical protein